MSDRTLRGSGTGKGVRLAVILCVLAMILPAMAFIPADASNADDDTIKVSTWDELKEAIEDGPEEMDIILTDNIIDDSDDDAIEIDDKRIININLNGFKIDRQRGYEDGDDGRLFEIYGEDTRVTISNGTLTGGHGDDGGCIYLDHVRLLRLQNVILTGNYSDGDGGAIYMKDESLLSFDGGKIFNNVCDGDGGAVYSEGDSFCAIDYSEVYENRAEDGSGGVLYSDDGAYEFYHCNVHDNYCSENGGAVYAKGVASKSLIADNLIDNSTFSRNHTEKDDDCNGGAVYIIKSYLIMYTSTFEDNYCGFDGGAIYAEDCSMDVYSPITFRNNNAPDSGGAMRLHGGDYYLGILTFEGNYANNCGGAIYINNDSIVSLWDITMTGNSARLDGGGLLVGADGDNKVDISSQIIIKDNTAKRDGDNVFLREDQVLKCGELNQNSRIGIELAEGKGKITKDFSKNNPDVDPAKIFFSDNSKYYIALDPDSGEAKTYKEGTGGDMSDDNTTTIWIAVGVIAAIAAIGAAAYFLVIRKP